LCLHLFQHLIRRKVVDVDDETFTQVAEMLRQPRERVERDGFHVCKGRGFRSGPHGPCLEGGLLWAKMYSRSRIHGRPLGVDARAAIGDVAAII